MSSRLVLHIGMPKCGSTSIQQFLLLESHALVENDVFVPKELNFDRSWRLSAASLNGKNVEYFSNILKVFSLSEFDNVKEKLKSDLQNIKLKLNDKNDYTLVVSSEYLYSKCIDACSVRALHDLFGDWFNEIEIVFVVKEPMVIIKSMYAQYIQGPSMGSISFEEYLENNVTSPIYDYSNQIELWTSVFKNSTLKVINLESLPLGESLIKVFANLILTRDNFLSNYEIPFSNKSLGYENLLLLSKFNSFKKNTKILRPLSFNNAFVRIIRGVIRHLPLGKEFPLRENRQLKTNYQTFLEIYCTKRNRP